MTFQGDVCCEPIHLLDTGTAGTLANHRVFFSQMVVKSRGIPSKMPEIYFRFRNYNSDLPGSYSFYVWYICLDMIYLHLVGFL